MHTLLEKIVGIIITPVLFLGSLLAPVAQAPDQNVGATLPQAAGVFETSLATPITSSATSMTLTTNAVRGGGAVSGYTCFTVDEGSAQAEVICGTVSGTAVTSMTRGISYSDGTTSVAGNKFAHRRGANVKITDFPILQILKAQNNGDETFPNPLKYDTGIGPIASSDLADKEYVLSVASGGAVSFEKVVEAGIAGETVAAGQLVYYKTSDSRWWLTDADTASTVENVVLGIAQGAGTAGNAITSGVMKSGIDTNQSGLSANTIYYASNTAGGLSSSAGTKEVTIGFAPSTTTLVFNPRFNQQITEDEQDALAGGGNLGTPSASNKYQTVEGVAYEFSGATIPRFGGTGADGVLNVTSGTTTISCAGAAICTKNYTTINISGGATVDFSNPNASGTIVILKATGTVTIAGTLDLRGMGGAASTSGTGILGTEVVAGQSAGASAGVAGAAFVTNKALYSKSADRLFSRTVFVYAGSGGGAGGNGDAPDSAAGGAGGRGGGGLLIESRGALNFSGTINTSGSNGSNGANGSSSSGGGGGGGGGSAGFALVLYNSLTANSGTITASGGTGGTGGSGSGGDCSGACHGGGGAGSYTGIGSTGEASSGNNGTGGGGGAGNPNGVGSAGGAAGGSEGGLVAQNLVLF